MDRHRFSGFVMVVALVLDACGGVQATTTPFGSIGPAGSVPSTAPYTVPLSSPSATNPSAASPTAAGTPADWPTYHGNGLRTGLATNFPAVDGRIAQAWSTKLDGAVYAEPLGVDGTVIAATEGDSVYALDPTTGAIVWRQHLGTPVLRSSLPCGNIDPLGITSTPVFDPSTGSLFVVAEVAGSRHVLFALDPASGATRWSRQLDLAGTDPNPYQQRAALALANGDVYVGFGGLYGDCGDYRGEVIGVPATGAGPTIAYHVPVAREGAVWATGGPVVDPTGNLYVSVGNGSSTSAYDGSDSVLELSSSLSLISRFAPDTWAQDNAGDADLGSMSPVIVPGNFVFIDGKSGTGYVLHQGALGGIGGQVSSRAVCDAFGAAAQTGATVVVPCSDGLRMITVSSAGSIQPGWHTGSGAIGPPVIGGGAIWSVDTSTGSLFALSPATGRMVASAAVGDVPHFATPTLWHDLVLIGTMAGITALRP